MLILGIAGLADTMGFLQRHFPDQMARDSRVIQGMDAAAALLADGKVIAAASEERFDRIKKSSAFPFQAVAYCLNAAGARMANVDVVCTNFNFGRYRPLYAAEAIARAYWQECLCPESVLGMLASRYPAATAARFYPTDHHDAHLHAARASCPFDEGLAIVMDAAGEAGATSVYYCRGPEITRLSRHPITQSLGMFYSLVTQSLGYAFNEDEYKVMGLASFGDPARYRDLFRSAIRLVPGGRVEIPLLTLNQGIAESLFFSATAAALARLLGTLDGPCSQQDRADISAALQQRFTEALFHICSHYREQTGATSLLLAGGCAENCSAVGELRNSGMFEQIHVGYASGDEGTALGAAAARSAVEGVQVRLPGLMPFFGPAPESQRVRDIAARDPRLVVQEFPSEQAMLDTAAEDIAADRIVALCHGRMEFGARALGNRSLLALPTKAANKDRINLAIKKRQNYRPFAPAVTLEDAHRYFVLNAGEAYPYMTMLTRVRDEARALLPAVTHVDGTARVQTVSRAHNAPLHALLTRLKELTGLPVVLNTSYNVNHQPIVCSEADAVETFIDMGIDALFIANARIAWRH